MTTSPIKGPKPYSKEWYGYRFLDVTRKKRPFVFGASEAAVLVGKSPYKTRLGLYLEKVGKEPPEMDNHAMLMGRLLEPVVLSLYEEKTGFSLIKKCPMYFSRDIWWMSATPDGIALNGGEWDRTVDAKTSSFRMYEGEDANLYQFGEDGTDQVPLDYIFQAQQQMKVCGVDRTDFPVLFDARTLRIYTVHRDERLISALVEAGEKLAKNILEGEEPEPDWSHDTTRSLLRTRKPEKVQEIGFVDEAVDGIWDQLQYCNKQIKKFEEMATELKNRLYEKVGEFGRAVLPSGRELNRIEVQDTFYSHQDVEKVQSLVGQLKRAGYEYYKERKAK